MQKRILIVDDDQRLRELLMRYLTEQGFEVQSASDAAGMELLFADNTYDLMVLDLMLPGEDGLAICRRLRGGGNNIPVIMLTARGDEVDRIVGLEMGADDYLPKPFNPRELMARINAVLRRHGTKAAKAPPEDISPTIQFGEFVFDPSSRSLHRNGTPISITSGEYALLNALASHPRQPLSRDRLMELARGRELDAFDRSVDVQVSRLRKLIESDPAQPRFIQTVWGYGYVFVPDGGPQAT
ncbi:MAG: two-component system response regulator OmpR [Methylophilaceae bacterium]|jgi:two-component system phosphate regulon response regulator OmpR|nr:two-component system response regulator OmpR [Methylophilaceae bacterium]